MDLLAGINHTAMLSADVDRLAEFYVLVFDARVALALAGPCCAPAWRTTRTSDVGTARSIGSTGGHCVRSSCCRCSLPCVGDRLERQTMKSGGHGRAAGERCCTPP
jgi:hypothetical protein